MATTFREARPEDREKIRELLTETGLPVESVGGGTTKFYIAEDGGRFLGTAGFEFYGDDALLRSVAIQPSHQRHGIGSLIVSRMLDEARRGKITKVILLTETAKDFFLRKGFRPVDRSVITNEELKKSSEFAFACPATAVCMVLNLTEQNKRS
jgi:N-acetylglutamate synthase-like GNAT family acetyltransferase